MSEITWYPCKFKKCDSSVAVSNSSKSQHCDFHRQMLCYRCGIQAVKLCDCVNRRPFCKHCSCTRCGEDDE